MDAPRHRSPGLRRSDSADGAVRAALRETRAGAGLAAPEPPGCGGRVSRTLAAAGSGPFASRSRRWPAWPAVPRASPSPLAPPAPWRSLPAMSSDLSTEEMTLPGKKRAAIRSWLMDMDGVLVHEQHMIPGADRFLSLLRERELPFLVLTNNSLFTRRDLSARLKTSRARCPRERDLDLRAGDGPVPRRPAARGFGVRDRRGRSHHGAACRRIHADRARPRLCRGRRDAHLQLLSHHAGDPSYRRRGTLYRHQPGSQRTEHRGPACPRPGRSPPSSAAPAG